MESKGPRVLFVAQVILPAIQLMWIKKLLRFEVIRRFLFWNSCEFLDTPLVTQTLQFHSSGKIISFSLNLFSGLKLPTIY